MEKRTTYSNPLIIATPETRVPTLLGAADSSRQLLFTVYSYALNKKPSDDVPDEHKDKGGIEDAEGNKHTFPGNIAPEGYFYSPFYEVTLKELDTELQSIRLKRINFEPKKARVTTSAVTFYNPDMGLFEERNITQLWVISPIEYDFLIGQPFAIYDVMDEITYRGHLDGFSSRTNGCEICITTEATINETDFKGNGEGANGQSRYIISLLEENAPEYAEYIPSTGKLVWRGPKKMSDLTSDSPIYNMPFTNGRLYIHKNINVHVRRQDPHADYKLFRPALNNPLRRFQVEGDAKLDFDYIQQIIDSMVDAC